jgi:hypothetical protein
MPGRAGRPVQSMIVVLRITIGVILGSSATVDHVARTEIPISNHPFPHHGSAFHWREQANVLIQRVEGQSQVPVGWSPTLPLLQFGATSGLAVNRPEQVNE